MRDDPERARWTRWWVVGLQMRRSDVRGIGWDQACSSVRALEQRKSHDRLIEAIPAPRRFNGQFVSRWSEQRQRLRQQAEDALDEGARRLQRDLNRRSVLCDRRHPCEVTISRKGLRAARAESAGAGKQKHTAPRVRVCLPRDVSHLNRTRVCDPWGERWQRNGGMYLDAWPQIIERWSSTNWLRVRREKRHCAEFDMESLSGWWRGLREEPAFLNMTNPLLGRHLAAKLLAGQRWTDIGAYLEALPELLSAADATMRTGAKGAGRTCAFVGSGHDLRCARRGREIDAHDAIFRANGAQQPEDRGRFMPPEMLGARTDYRVNCLHNSSALPSMRSEVCIIPLPWWLQKPGGESVGNTARSCCERLTRSSYQPSALLPLVKRGFTFAFLNGAASFIASLPLSLNGDPTLHGPGLADSLLFPKMPVTVPSDSFLSNSGGNALYAALALCDRVNVFGAGLFSEEGASGDKLYAHSYDDRVGRCATPTRGLGALRMAQAAPGANENINGVAYAPRWLRSRIQDELLLHVMHAFDIIRWVQ